jgi:hypothetical protein
MYIRKPPVNYTDTDLHFTGSVSFRIAAEDPNGRTKFNGTFT